MKGTNGGTLTITYASSGKRVQHVQQ